MKNNRVMNFEAPGTVVYGPKRGVNKDGTPIIDKDRCVIQINGFGICDYYAYQFKKKFGIELIRPSWEPHVTVINNRRNIRDKKYPWGYRDREKVMVEYSHQMFWNDEHVWVAADCEAVYDIRRNANYTTYDRGHFTIGKFHEKDIGKIPVFKKYEDISYWEDFIFNKPL